jgi:hypothetical protein
LLRGAEQLFRSQEHGYRALALFRRAGAELPASSGVCGSLRLAQTEGERSFTTMTQAQAEGTTHEAVIRQANELKEAAESWMASLAAIRTDLQCETD